MINELDTVVLTRDVPDHGLSRGARGVVVDRRGDRMEVEFMNVVGRTIAVLSLSESDVAKLETVDESAEAGPTVDDLLSDELRALEAELKRIGTSQAPPVPAQRTPLRGRLMTVKWLKSQCPMTPEEFEHLLRRLASGEIEIPGDRLKMAQRQSKDMLDRWMVLTSSTP